MDVLLRIGNLYPEHNYTGASKFELIATNERKVPFGEEYYDRDKAQDDRSALPKCLH